MGTVLSCNTLYAEDCEKIRTQPGSDARHWALRQWFRFLTRNVWGLADFRHLRQELRTKSDIMSIHWTLIAGFLYAEIAAVLLLLLPFISPKRWNSIFKSRFLQALGKQSFFYFCVVISVLVLSFLDAIREMKKYSGDAKSDESTHGHLDVEIQHHMRLFRAQRNFYISGFALFLFLVLRRLVSLVALQASLEASNEAAMRQAASASSAAERLLQDRPASAAGDQQLTKLKEQLEKMEEERDTALKKAEMLQCQAEATSEEYDKLMAEHDKLQRQLNVSGDKKED